MTTEIMVALIGMAAAVWAPTVTTCLTMKKELKLKKLEIYQQSKKDSYINFSRAISKAYSVPFTEYSNIVDEIITAGYQVLIYTPDETSNKIIELLERINITLITDIASSQELRALVYEVIELLNHDMKKNSN